MTTQPTDPVDWIAAALPECFVIQPFDGGQFDKRYQDVYAPAIHAAGLQPYRVDRDPAASVPIDQIARRIRQCSVCFADISEDNPNVWFELGLAIAANRELTLVCSERRETFPFDVQHRSIIRYKTESSSDFESLSRSIIMRLKASLGIQRGKDDLADMSPVKQSAGLSPHEQVLLVLAAQRMDAPTDTISAYLLRRDMSETGFNEIAFVLSSRSLVHRGLIERDFAIEQDDEYVVYRVSEAGFDWLEKNQDKLELRLKSAPS